jgi:two-component system phosphate regulon sensor histidine kinase PhoR
MDEDTVGSSLLSGLISELPLGLVLLELDGEVIDYNRPALSLLNLDEVQILTDNFIELIPPGPLSQAVSEVVIGRAARTRVETAIEGKSVSLIVQRLAVEGQADKLMLLMEDISRFRDLERIKTEFITEMLHRLRTPLTTISSGLSMLVAGHLGDLPEKTGKVISISHSETNRMILLVNDLRNLLLIESHQMAKMFEMEDRTLAEVIAGATSSVETLAQDEGVTLKIPEPPESLRVRVDRGRAVEALAGILSNAVIFSPGSAEVGLEYNQGADEVVLSVTDKGIGIASENLARVTEKFFREDNEITRGREGNGLGLYLTKSLLELMEGGLRIESRQGYGTRVTLTFRRSKEA